MTALEKFTHKVMNAYLDDITDQVFLKIQNTRGLMEDYLKLVKNHEVTIDQLNRKIGNVVKNSLNIGNKGKYKKQPKSTLIKSYERHKLSD